MKGAKAIVGLLNDVLAGELVAINQYFLHAKLCKHWGYGRLASQARRKSICDMKHAEELIERVLFLEGIPNLQRLDALHVGQTVPEQFKSDLDAELQAVKRLNDGVRLCRDSADRATEVLLAEILTSEEEHVDWIETQLAVIARIGEAAYLAEQLEDG